MIALDDIANLIFAEVTEFYATLQADADFLHIVLKTAQGGDPAIVDRLTPAQDTRPGGAADPSITDQAAGDDPAAQLKDLFHFGVADNGLAMLGIEQAGHGRSAHK